MRRPHLVSLCATAAAAGALGLAGGGALGVPERLADRVALREAPASQVRAIIDGRPVALRGAFVEVVDLGYYHGAVLRLVPRPGTCAVMRAQVAGEGPGVRHAAFVVGFRFDAEALAERGLDVRGRPALLGGDALPIQGQDGGPIAADAAWPRAGSFRALASITHGGRPSGDLTPSLGTHADPTITPDSLLAAVHIARTGAAPGAPSGGLVLGRVAPVGAGGLPARGPFRALGCGAAGPG